MPRINKENCIGCSLCVLTCPEVFKIDSDGLCTTILKDVPHELVPKVAEAARECPTGAILLDEDE